MMLCFKKLFNMRESLIKPKYREIPYIDSDVIDLMEILNFGVTLIYLTKNGENDFLKQEEKDRDVLIFGETIYQVLNEDSDMYKGVKSKLERIVITNVSNSCFNKQGLMKLDKLRVIANKLDYHNGRFSVSEVLLSIIKIKERYKQSAPTEVISYIYDYFELPNSILTNTFYGEPYLESYRNTEYKLEKILEYSSNYHLSEEFMSDSLYNYFMEYKYNWFSRENKENLNNLLNLPDILIKNVYIKYSEVDSFMSMFYNTDFLEDIYKLSILYNKNEFKTLSNVEQQEFINSQISKIMVNTVNYKENNLLMIEQFMSK